MRLLLILLFCMSGLYAQSIRENVNRGNDQYRQEAFEEALNHYQNALLDDPQNDVVQFNQGNAHYKLQKYDKALESYQKTLGTEDLQLEQQAYYNIGNTYFQQNNLVESINAYKKALELNPNDRDAKYNLELARAKLKELADKQQSSPEQQPQQGDQQNQDGIGDQGGEDQNEQEQQQPEQQSEGEQQSVQPAEESEQISKEDAEKILQALKNDEKDAQKLRKPQTGRRQRAEKDW